MVILCCTDLFLAVGVLIFVIVVTVGAQKGDRNWMPRADLIWLSWGYACAVAASMFALIASAFFGLEAKHYWGSKAPISNMFDMPMLYREGDAGAEPPEGGSVFGY